jgi:hypothetical protein
MKLRVFADAQRPISAPTFLLTVISDRIMSQSVSSAVILTCRTGALEASVRAL